MMLAIAVMLTAAVCSWYRHGLLYDLLRTDADANFRVTRLKQYFNECGIWAPLAYVAFVTVEVVIAPLPGLMLYAPGGLVFGPVAGGLLAIIGNVLGAGTACCLTRMLSPQSVEKFLTGQSVSHAQNVLEQRGSWLIFLLRLNPLTSSDLISYAAGFTRIPVSQVMLATGCGMAPACMIQSWLSDTMLTAFPELLLPLVIVCMVCMFAAGIITYRILFRVT